MSETRIRMAIQKSGRLSERSVDLLEKCGIDFSWRKNTLLNRCRDFPLDLMLVRDDDIPEYVRTGVCDLGIVGENVIAEHRPPDSGRGDSKIPARRRIKVVRELGFGRCRLSLAVPKETAYDGVEGLRGSNIATSYPVILGDFLAEKGVDASIIELTGSVEIAPALAIAEAICDLVSTGSTLESNGLREVETIFTSQAVLVTAEGPAPKGGGVDDGKERTILRLARRIDGVLKAAKSKYIMMNAPADKVEAIRDILPGMEAPSVLPLLGQTDRVAIHAVATEDVFWDTMNRLKDAGAASILVVPIEKIID